MKRGFQAALSAVLAAAFIAAGAGSARAGDIELGLAFLFPIPVPVPIYKIDHDPSPVTLGLLFPVPLPVPVYDYGDGKDKAGEEEQPQTRYGRLQTMVSPRHASVYVDGEYMGEAGDFYFRKDALTVRPGDHSVEFAAEGYETYSADVHVSPGGLVNISRDLRPSR